MESDLLQNKKYLKFFWILILAPMAFFCLLFLAVSFGWIGDMPNLKDIDNPQSNLASEVYSADGKILGTYFIENRNNTDYNELPQFLVNALIAREDQRFYAHSGIDVHGLLRVLFKTVLLGKKSEGGGSTISQQLAKSLFPRDTAFYQAGVMKMAVTKLKEWVIAIELERKYSKSEIITMYLNSVAFSNEVYGIKTASQVYFNKPPDSLKIEEAALLIGMLKGITLYNPRRNPERALNRRNSVLNKMFECGYLDKNRSDSIKRLPVRLNYHPQTSVFGLATYAREYIRQIMCHEKPLREKYASPNSYSDDSSKWEDDPLFGWCNKNFRADGSKYNLYKDGLKIYTTLDSRMQEYAEKSLTAHLSKTLQPGFFLAKKGKRKAPFANYLSDGFIQERLKVAMRQSDRYRSLKNNGYSEKEIMQNFKERTDMRIYTWKGFKDTLLSPWDSIRYSKYFLKSSFLAVDPHTGAIKAYVGGPDIRYFKYDGVMMQKRQVGSTIKPFIYTVALNQGYKPCDMVLNAPVYFPLPNGKIYSPQNDERSIYDDKMVPLSWGLAHSVNNVAAYLYQQTKYSPLYDLLRKLNIKSVIPDVPSICLGTPEFSIYEMVGAYTVFPGKGIYTQPQMVSHIEDKNGKLLTSFMTRKEEVLSEKTAYSMVRMLREVVTKGTAERIPNVYNLKYEIAGKTGTTQNQSDGWFIGFTPDLVAGVWVGGDEPSIHFDYMSQGQGASMALPIYALFMQKVYADKSLNFSQAPFEKPENYDAEMECNLDEKDMGSEEKHVEESY
jgi:penicillin-binding protein 1A